MSLTSYRAALPRAIGMEVTARGFKWYFKRSPFFPPGLLLVADIDERAEGHGGSEQCHAIASKEAYQQADHASDETANQGHAWNGSFVGWRTTSSWVAVTGILQTWEMDVG